ncbi:MAG TPA: hypothetical protein HPP97_00040 [Desulfuromonadales bacterium]|nr:hypothetical protein [Desulfuromonadales bacterium]
MQKKIVVALAAAMLMLVPVCSFAAVANNEITSAKIKDGEVKTADIANQAVTTVKIADGAVTDAKISGTISAAKLPIGTSATSVAAGNHTHVIGTTELADAAVTATKLAVGSVGANAIAAGAIDTSKISGIIGAEKLATYANVITVHKGAANNVTTFNTVRAAINAIGQNSASYAGERQAILVMPGRYEEDLSLFGDSQQTFNVDIIGASRTGTIIVPTSNAFYDFGTYLLMPSGMYLKNLTFNGIILTHHAKNAGVIGADVVTNSIAFHGGWQTIQNFVIDDVNIETGPGGQAIGFWGNAENDTLRFNNIRIKRGYIVITYPITSKTYTFSNITFTDGNVDSPAFYVWYGNSNTPDPKFVLNNITVDGTYGYGVLFNGTTSSKISIMNSKIDVAKDLVYGTGSTNNIVSIMNSDIAVVSNNQGSAPAATLNIGNSRIGTIIPNSQSMKLVNCFDGNFEPLANGVR